MAALSRQNVSFSKKHAFVSQQSLPYNGENPYELSFPSFPWCALRQE